MIRLFDTEDPNPQEYKGMKVGGVICTYNAGFHILDKIVRRFCSEIHYNTHHKNKPDDAPNKLNIGDEYSPNFQYTKIDPDTCKLGRKGECDSYYCHPGIPTLEEQISRLQRQRNRLKEYANK